MKWVRYFLICCLSLFVISCDKETAMQPREEVSLKRDKSYEYEKIQKPDPAFSKDMKQMYLIAGEEVPYFIFRMRTSGKKRHGVILLQKTAAMVKFRLQPIQSRICT